MITIDGTFFDGLRPVAIQAQLVLSGPHARLTTDSLNLTYAQAELSVSPRITSADRFISLPDGRQFLCADQAFLDNLPQESPSEGVVAWLENRSLVALVSVILIAATLAAGYFYGLPYVARGLAARIPMETEQALGQQVLSWFDDESWLRPSQLDFEQREKIHRAFDRLCEGLSFESFYRLEMRSGRVFGPNAVALPGGIIVLTDELVELADSTNEIAAVLAHEIGHVELRHAMRGVLQNSIVAIAVAAVTADAANLGTAVAGLPAVLAQTKYSREFEADADKFAFDLLRHKGRSPEAFASIMTKLSEENGSRAVGFHYLSTHPATEERVKNAINATH